MPLQISHSPQGSPFTGCRQLTALAKMCIRDRVKSLRAGGVNLKDSWVDIENGELLVKGMHLSLIHI